MKRIAIELAYSQHGFVSGDPLQVSSESLIAYMMINMMKQIIPS